MYQAPVKGWDKRELFWVGIELADDVKAKEISAIRFALRSLPQEASAVDKLTDGTVVSTYQLPAFGMCHVIYGKRRRLIGFGIRVNSALEGRMLVGKANRVLGSLTIDQEAGLWVKTIFDKPEVE